MCVDGVRHAEVHMANGSLLLRFDPLREIRVLTAVGAFDGELAAKKRRDLRTSVAQLVALGNRQMEL